MSSLRFRSLPVVLLLAVAGLLLIPEAQPARVSWDDLIAPLAVGMPVTRGFMLAPARRGAEGDVVYVARREAGPGKPAARVEVHVLDRGRWADVPETRSFSVGWEMPRAGALVAASREDADAVRDALRDAIARNDTGFASAAAIPLTSEMDAPLIARILDRLSGVRGILIGAAVAGALILLVEVPGGPAVAGTFLLVLGFALRAAELAIPFAHDQDVQRLFTGGLPLRDIITGAGLQDRHPPLYFLLLHFVESFGQSEAVGRFPAVLAGALAAPALLLAVACLGRPINATAVLAACMLAVSPELIAQARQVSEIPLYALILLAASASLVAAVAAPRAARLLTVALSHALAMYTYYLTPFVWAAHAAVLAVVRPTMRVVLAFAVGVLAGLPALLLGAVTLLRDWGARDVARAFPGLAWGEHTPLALAAEMSRVVSSATGAPFVVVALAATSLAVIRRDRLALAPALAAVSIFIGTALLSPIARVQSYYITTVVPLIALVIAVTVEPRRRIARYVWQVTLLLALALGTVPLLARARTLYLPSGDAFMPRFAGAILQRPETTVVTVAQYDKTLLAYYLARAQGREIGWHTIDTTLSQRIEPLLQVHALGSDSETAALQRLEEILAAGPALVIERDAFLLPRLGARLAECELLLQAPTARLSRCASD